MFQRSNLGVAAAAAAAATIASTAAGPWTTDTLLITGGRVLAAEGDRWLEGHAVLIADGRIVKVASVETIDVHPELPHIDLDGGYLVPGLIDLHTHLMLHPYDEASWAEQVLKESLGLRTARAVAAAQRTLEAGFTTIRELGTEGAGYADVGLRDAVAGGIVPGPTILTATRALVASGAYGPAGFDPRWAIPKGAQVADGPDAVRRAVREQIAAGADWIKVYADYRRRPGVPATPTFSPAELEAAVDEARTAGLGVSAHASTDEGIRRAVEAGVRTIEHGTNASAETLALMRDRGVTLCPTLAAAEANARYQGWAPPDPQPEQLRRAMAMFQRALAAGVRIACGSDAGVFAHGDNARELKLMVAGGMTATEALKSATAVAAEVIGKEENLGRIAPGFTADLVAVSGNPLLDIAALSRPIVVVKKGHVVVDRRAIPAQETRAELLAVCQRVFETLAEGRIDDLNELFLPEAVVTFELRSADKQISIGVEQFLERAREQYGPDSSFREWISGEPTVLVDGAIAVVWAPFLVEKGGLRATGVDVFGFLKIDGHWRISSLSFTNRPVGSTSPE